MTTLQDRFSRTSVALEFKEDSFIISFFKSDLSGVNLQSSSSFPLNDDDKAIAEINEFISRFTFDHNNIFVCIPHKWAIIKFIDVPPAKGKGKNALSQLMKFEIGRHIPFEVDDVFYDFQLIEKSETAYTIMFASVFKEKIDYVKGFLDKIFLKPRIITLSPFAALNAVEYSGYTVGGWQELLGLSRKPDIIGRKGKLCLSLSFDKNDINIFVIKNGLPMLFRSSHLDPDQHSNELAENIVSKINSILADLSIERVDRIILSGSIYQKADLPDVLRSKLETDVKTVNPVSLLFYGEPSENAHILTPSLGVYYAGLGIGSLKFNLLPHKTDIVLKKTGTLLAKVSIPLIIILIFGIFTAEIVHEKTVLSRIEKQIIANDPEVKIIEKISAESEVFMQKRDFLGSVRNDKTLLNILTELSEIIPPDAWLINFNYKTSSGKEKDISKRELIISGFAASSSVLISLLEDSSFFEKVEFVGPITKKMNKEGFKIRADVISSASFAALSLPQVEKVKIDLDTDSVYEAGGK